MLRRLGLLVGIAVALAGCQTVLPSEPSFDRSPLLPPGVTLSDASKRRLKVPTAGAPTSCTTTRTAPERNTCIYDLKTVIDAAYITYLKNLENGIDYSNLGFDAGSLIFSTASTAAGGESAKTTLSAISTVLTGTKTAVSQDLLLKSTVNILIGRMEADRSARFTAIAKQMKAPIEEYTMGQARNDILGYFQAGTLPSALSSLQAQTGAAVAKCKAAEQVAKTEGADSAANKGADGGAALSGDECAPPVLYTSVYNYEESGKAIRAIWKPDGKTINDDNQQKLESCLTKLNIKESLTSLIYGSDVSDKDKVLGCFKASAQ